MQTSYQFQINGKYLKFRNLNKKRTALCVSKRLNRFTLYLDLIEFVTHLGGGTSIQQIANIIP